MSDSSVSVEEIARLAGHTSSRTTEIIYRHQLRSVMEKGAEAMDQLFGALHDLAPQCPIPMTGSLDLMAHSENRTVRAGTLSAVSGGLVARVVLEHALEREPVVADLIPQLLDPTVV